MRSCLLSFVALAASNSAWAVCTQSVGGVTTVVPCPDLPDVMANMGPNTCGPGGAAACIDDEDAFIPGVHPATARLRRVDLTDPDATCNDGDQAVYYVRRAPTLAGKDNWVIMLEGGGSAFRSADADLGRGIWERWTGDDGQLLSWIDKTSARNNQSDVHVGGLLSASSAFANWNWVYINYCSSDTWMGQESAVELVPPTTLSGWGSWTDAGVTHIGFQADFNGHRIIEAVLDDLDAGLTFTDSDDFTWTYPSLADAEKVLFAGESAGGAGVRNNLDFVADRYPAADVWGSIGANFKPAIGVMGVDPWYVDSNLDGIDDIFQGHDNQWVQKGIVNGFVDQTCETNLGDWRCLHLYSVEMDSEIATTHLVKQDMTDSLLRDGYPSAAAYAQGVQSGFVDIEALAGSATLFGPNFGHHETLSNAQHFNDRIKLCEPGPVTHDILWYNKAISKVVAGTGTSAWTSLVAPPATWMSVAVCPP